MPSVKKIRVLNLPGTPWACPGLLRETFTFISSKEHLPEDDHNRWPKQIYNKTNLHICMHLFVGFLIIEKTHLDFCGMEELCTQSSPSCKTISTAVILTERRVFQTSLFRPRFIYIFPVQNVPSDFLAFISCVYQTHYRCPANWNG